MVAVTILPDSGVNAQTGEITEQDMQRHEAARESYDEYCAACHGYDGIPILPGTPNFVAGERLEKSDEELLETISKGRDLMPPWEAELDSEQRQQLVNYIRGMAGEQVFQQQCSSCHENSVPALSSAFPGSRKAVLEYAGEIDFCTSEVEVNMSRKDIADVAVFLTSLER